MGHVSFDIISFLAKLGRLSITLLLPKPHICSSCQLSKSKRLPFELNAKRSLHVLDLIPCDLWGPSPVQSTEGYRYYVIFVNDYSCFTWLYPLTTKSDVSVVLSAFFAFVQTQSSSKVKIFQSDGGTEFLSSWIQPLFMENDTHHRVSCPYTPQQNGQVERKHRHFTKLVLLCSFMLMHRPLIA